MHRGEPAAQLTATGNHKEGRRATIQHCPVPPARCLAQYVTGTVCCVMHASPDLARRHTNPMVDEKWIRSERLANPPGLLPRMAAKRRRSFASKEAAKQAFARKPMFSTFSTDALTSYVEHGFRELPGEACFGALVHQH